MPAKITPKKQPNAKLQAEATPDRLHTNAAITHLAQNNDGLPDGWRWVKLGDIGLKSSLKVLPTEYPNAKFIGMDCIEPHTLKPSFTYQFNEFKSSGNFFEKGQVLYGRMRPYLNKVYRAEFDGTCSGEFIVLKCLPNFSPDLLTYILHSRNFVRFANHKTSGDRPRISYEEIADYAIALPPIDHQHAIVSKIEELLSELDKGKQQLETAQQQLKIYRQAVLKWAFEGKLTASEDKINITPFGTIVKIVSGNTPKGLEEIGKNGSVQFYKVSDMNLEGNEIEMNFSKFNLTKAEIGQLKIKLYPKGTVIFPKRGGAILTNKKRILATESAFDLNLMGALPNEKVSSKYLFYWFVKLDLGKIYDGSNVPQINNKNVEPLEFPLCSMEDQHLIVQEIESRLSVCDKVEETITTSLAQAETLRQSILKKAFEGKLV